MWSTRDDGEVMWWWCVEFDSKCDGDVMVMEFLGRWWWCDGDGILGPVMVMWWWWKFLGRWWDGDVLRWWCDERVMWWDGDGDEKVMEFLGRWCDGDGIFGQVFHLVSGVSHKVDQHLFFVNEFPTLWQVSHFKTHLADSNCSDFKVWLTVWCQGQRCFLYLAIWRVHLARWPPDKDFEENFTRQIFAR